MKPLEQFEDYKQQIKKLHSKIEAVKITRDEYCENNRAEVKTAMPSKGKVYQVIDYSKVINSYWGYEVQKGDIFYFRPTDTTLYIQGRGHTFSIKEDLCVKGDVLDCEFKVIQYNNELSGSDTTVRVDNLKERDIINTYKHRLTKVYVMIDKNTGYYKIGRSKTPLKREKTLQSEKPTIEMLFFDDAKNKDVTILHQMFSEKIIRGEWFDLSGGDLTIIKDYFLKKTG
jgi:hypothetical protein